MTNEDISGIYLIKNTQTGKLYIGESKHIYTRWLQHKEQLANGAHYNKPLQNDYDIYGESSFEYILYQEVRENTGDKTILKAKLLILEHCYLNYFKKHCDVYNIRDSLNDVLMDTDYYMNDPVRKANLSRIKDKILTILRSHIITSKNGRYDLEKKVKLFDIFSKEGVRFKRNIQDFIDLIPPEEFSRIIAKREIKFMKNGEPIIETAYIVKDERKVIEYLRDNFYSGLKQDTIAVTSMYRRLKMLNIITNKNCSRNRYYNILVKNNIITRHENKSEPTKWAIDNGLIDCSSKYVVLTEDGMDYVEKVFARIFL